MEDSIRNQIKNRRKELKLTQAQLAQLSHISQQHISLIEKGFLEPTLKTLRQICQTLHLDLNLQPKQSPIEQRITALQKFNNWEESHRERLSPEEIFKKTGALVEMYQNLHKTPRE